MPAIYNQADNMPQNENNLFSDFNSDRPIKKDIEDKLGFQRVAENLASSVTSGSVEDGLVIGIEGAWG